MAEYLIQDTTLTGIAEAIRIKTGKTGTITPAEMPDEIKSIASGGGMEDVATEAEMDAKLSAGNLGNIFRFTGVTTSKYTQGDIYIVEEVTS